MKYIIFFGILLCLIIVFYIYINRKKYTRERYAFFATTSIFIFAGAVLFYIFTDNSLFKIGIVLINTAIGTDLPIPQTSWLDKLWSVLIFGGISILIYNFYKNWDGAKSTEEVNFGSQDIIKNFLIGIPGKKITISVEDSIYIKDLDKPYFDVSLDWHSDVAEMLKIISNKYYIDIDKDWYSEEGLFLSKFSQQNMTIFCSLYEPSLEVIKNKIKFTKEHIDGELHKFIIAIKNGKKSLKKEHIDDIEVEYRYKDELLNSLVNFNEYFDFIKYEYEKKEISYGDKLTLQDIYTKSQGEICDLNNSSESEIIESVEDYLLAWTETKSHKQISLLGEYGQGKSVLSLKLAYEMIKNSYSRIPIIIELRGKSPRNDQLEDIIGSWARKFHIDPMGVFRLMIEGRLVIILEGFDEIDMIGDSNRRLEHFNRLWEFVRYEKSKVMITGRPNLFLDNEEMTNYLKNYKNSTNLFYSEPIHIKSFNHKQIAYALRNVDNQIREEILIILQKSFSKRYEKNLSVFTSHGLGDDNGAVFELTQNNLSSFEDLMARPSTLYQASIIWNELDNKNINSALVIEEFLNYTYKRQEEKLRVIGRTGIETFLTINERKYFIFGIAIKMLQKSRYTNQINSTDLEKIIQNLYVGISDKISFDHPEGRTLKIRMKDNKNALASIYNDIRTSTILVRDFTKNNSFRFAHKSFLDYLVAKYFFVYKFKERTDEYHEFVGSIGNINGLNLSEESLDFIFNMISYKYGENKICDNIYRKISILERVKIFLLEKERWILTITVILMIFWMGLILGINKYEILSNNFELIERIIIGSSIIIFILTSILIWKRVVSLKSFPILKILKRCKELYSKNKISENFK